MEGKLPSSDTPPRSYYNMDNILQCYEEVNMKDDRCTIYFTLTLANVFPTLVSVSLLRQDKQRINSIN